MGGSVKRSLAMVCAAGANVRAVSKASRLRRVGKMPTPLAGETPVTPSPRASPLTMPPDPWWPA